MGQALRAIVAVYTGREVDAVTEAEVLAFPWAQMGFQHVQKVRAALAERYAAPASANKILSALRGVLYAAFRLGQMSAEEYQRASDVEAVKGSTLPKGRALKTGEIGALFEACDPGKAQGARDAALLAVLYAAGLRRSEAVALDLGDYDQETGVLTVRSGKGRKARTGHATNGAKAALDAWLVKRGWDAGPFFLPIHRSGSIQGRRMTDQSVLSILERIRLRAKVRPSPPTTSAAPSSPTSSTGVPTSPRSRGWPGTPTSRRPRGTTGEGRRRRGRRRSCCMCRLGVRSRENAQLPRPHTSRHYSAGRTRTWRLSTLTANCLVDANWRIHNVVAVEHAEQSEMALPHDHPVLPSRCARRGVACLKGRSEATWPRPSLGGLLLWTLLSVRPCPHSQAPNFRCRQGGVSLVRRPDCHGAGLRGGSSMCHSGASSKR